MTDKNVENTEGYVNPKYDKYVKAEDIFEDDVFEETEEYIGDDIFDDESIADIEVINGNFDEVLDITSNTESNVMVSDFSGSSNLIMAEFNPIDTIAITEKQTKLADKFIKQVSSFIKSCDDVSLSQNHRKYIDTVAELKLANLAELLILREMNKDLISNIVIQINNSGGEDFVLINNYNTLIKTQMDLVKNTNTLINQMPNEFKNLRNDILTQTELISANKDEITDVVTSSNNVHNNGKTLLNKLKEMQQLKEQKNNDNKNS